jgi:hypothetical protein
MRRSYEEFTVRLAEGVGELGITLKEPQIQQFFFIFRNSKNGIKKSI